MLHEYLPCAKVINIHGFRGTVKLESYCDTPNVLAHLPTVYVEDARGGYLPRRVLHASVFRQFVLMDVEGVTTEAAANAMRGVTLFASRKDLPLAKGSHFVADLIGLPVKDADTDALLGTLTDVRAVGGRELYTVKNESGEHLVPAVKEFVVRVDPDDAVYLRPIPGLLDGEAVEL